ncbi:acyl-CoA dehydrogenase [Salinibacterium hongtaonis]|uniref:Acyl-CoA dehydrogenase n=1 Tax=Homoserinimonas hongtaonis TaxID=2079791 RepID=A0A2U1SXI8_9MICO|nr:acyl-CoA dehydrogenase [Salinibacterium hongtaonis]PWB96347.1 acyl-CoA dehydrogenase [Salinibacterium hongtaonis]
MVPEPIDIAVTGGSPTATEAAAVVAVVSSVVDELREADDPAPVATSAWMRSARSLRTPLRAGPGAWAASRPLR